MKIGILMILITLIGSLRAEEAGLLDGFMQERVQANIQFKKEFTETAETEGVRKAEERNGQQWIDFTKLVQASNDDRLKCEWLLLEFYQEVAILAYDLEWQEGLEKMGTKAKILVFEDKIRQIQEYMKQNNIGE